MRVSIEDDASDEIEKISSNAKSKWSSVAKAATAAMAAMYTAAVAVGTKAVMAFANFEQLVGGVETLFGAGGQTIEEYAESVGKTVEEISDEYSNLMAAQSMVLENAANAYITAGMSANDYMDTVTGISASLIQSVGGDTVRAAEMADMAIQDMSDNANKMGTDIESIVNAYQGFAKQNYTMLDNLKLGYGGTASEAERLILDAAALDDTIKLIYDDNGDLVISYDTLVQSIHVIQDEMGITGTTMRESSETIEGSIKTAKAAFTNWLVGLADGTSNLSDLTKSLVDSVVTAANNIVPRVVQTFESLIVALPDALNQLVPIAVNAVVGLIPVLIEMIPQFIDVGLQMFATLLDSLKLVVVRIVKGLPDLIEDVVNAIVDNIPAILDAGLTLFQVLAHSLINSIPTIIDQLPTLIDSFVVALIDFTPQLFDAAIKLFLALVEAIPQIWGRLKEAVSDLIIRAVERIGELRSNVIEAGKNLIQGLIDGIVAKGKALVDKAKEVVSGAVHAVKRFLGIASPSKLFRQFGVYSMEGLAEGIEDAADAPADAMMDAVSKISNPIDLSIAKGNSVGGFGSVTNNYYSINGIEVADDEIKKAIESISNYSMLRRAYS